MSIVNNFVYYNPTKIYFGNEQLGNLADEVKKYGSKVCLVYGGGSIKKYGLYDKIMKVLGDAGIEVAEAANVEPNPQYTTVNRAAKICRENNCDVVIGVGGGSVIDTAKMVTHAPYYDGDCWDLITQKAQESRCLPLIAIPTFASAGSENDAWAVVSNFDTFEKRDILQAGYQPVASFIDPVISATVDPYQTAVGAADIFAHTIEIRYLLKTHKIEFVSEMMEVMAKNIVKYGIMAVNEPDNMEARQNLSWMSAMITGGIMDMGAWQDMILHMAEYGIAAFYEIPHGHGIAILFPRWLQYILSDETAPIIYQLGKSVFAVEEGLETKDGAQKTIDAMSKWLFEDMGLEKSLAKLGATEDKLPEMAAKATAPCNGVLNGITTLDTKDIENIFRMCM